MEKLALGLGAAILLIVLVGVAGWRGYRAGYASADLKRQAEVAAIRAEHSQAFADAEAEARRQLQTAVNRGNVLEEEFLAAKKVIANQTRQLSNQRIRNASLSVDTADGVCRFGPEWVCLFNEAIGAGDRDLAVSAATSGTAGTPGTAKGSGTRILQGVKSVTPEDILACVRDFGQRSRHIETQLVKLIQWAKTFRADEVTQ